MSRFICLLIPVLVGSALHAAVVYQNTSTPTGVVNALLPAGQTNSTEHGNTVTVAGTERILTNVTVHLRILGAGVASFNRELRLYRNDGMAGMPGTLLWASGQMFSVIDSGAPIPYSFAVPNVVVGGSFTWTIQITNRQTNHAQMGPYEYNPPTIGSAPFGYWRRTGPGLDAWEFTGQGEAPFGARIDAAACPTPRNGDVNGDGIPNGRDIAEFTHAALSGSSAALHTCAADFNDNGLIDTEDVVGLTAVLLGP